MRSQCNFKLTSIRGKCICVYDLWSHGALLPPFASNPPYTRVHNRRHLRLSRHCFVRDPTRRRDHGEPQLSTRCSTKSTTHLHARNWFPGTRHYSIRRLMHHFPSAIIPIEAQHIHWQHALEAVTIRPLFFSRHDYSPDHL